MKTIKSLPLFLLLAVTSNLNAMQQPTIASIVEDLKAIEQAHPDDVNEARLRMGIASQHGVPMYYLHAAIAGRKKVAIHALAQAGIPEERDKKDRTPLDHALETNYTEGITTLMQYPHLRNSNYGPKPVKPAASMQAPEQATFLHYCEEAKKVWSVESEPAVWQAITMNVVSNAPASLVQTFIAHDLLPMPQTPPNCSDKSGPLYDQYQRSVRYNAMMSALVQSNKYTLPEPVYLSIVESKKREFLTDGYRSTADELAVLLANYKKTLPLDESMWEIYAQAKKCDRYSLANLVEKRINPETEWQAACEAWKALPKAADTDKDREPIEQWLFRANIILSRASHNFKINPEIARDIYRHSRDAWQNTSHHVYNAQECLHHRLKIVIEEENERKKQQEEDRNREEEDRKRKAHLAQIREGLTLKKPSLQ